MLVEATAAKDPARFHSVDKICAHHDKQIIWLVVMRNSQSPLGDNLASATPGPSSGSRDHANLAMGVVAVRMLALIVPVCSLNG